MMKSISRDISLTLILKIALLVLLWWVGFSHIERPKVNAQKWMLGSIFEVNNDSRN